MFCLVFCIAFCVPVFQDRTDTARKISLVRLQQGNFVCAIIKTLFLELINSLSNPKVKELMALFALTSDSGCLTESRDLY